LKAASDLRGNNIVSRGKICLQEVYNYPQIAGIRFEILKIGFLVA
jgi:hypothetical protein